MSSFTIVLGHLVDDPNVDLGLQTYPIYDEANPAVRTALNKKIVDHYRNYEIGHETISQFVFALNRKMNEIMPYYNLIYASTQIAYDPLSTIDLTNAGTTADTRHETTATAGNSTSDSTSAARNVSSETPQTRLSGDEDYATSAADANSTAHSVSESAGTGTTDGSVNGTVNSTVNGRQIPAALLIMQYRQAIINVDLMVISELETLFMGLWYNGYDFLDEGYGCGSSTGFFA